MSILQVLYILSSFILIFGAAVIYMGNRRNRKHRTFALIFVFMAFWQQSALLISLVPPEQANYVFMYGLIPFLLGSLMLLLHAVYLITDVYTRKYAIFYKLLLIPPVINVLLFPVDGWLYRDEVMVYSEHSLPGPGGFINFGLMFIYMVVMIALLLPKVMKKHRPSQIWLIGMTIFILWSLVIIVIGEMSGEWDSFSFVPLGINIWAAAVYISVKKFDSLPSYERRYHVLFDRAPIGILIIDSQGIILEASPRASEFLDIPLEYLLGHSIFEWLDDENQDREFQHYLDNVKHRKVIQHYEVSFRNKNDELKWIEINSDFIEVEGDANQLLMIKDITETKQREKQVHNLAYFDHLTSLPNRVSFNNTFEEWLKEKKEFGFLILDLDAFKNINDDFGHLIGDQALQYFAKQLQESVKATDFVARLSGDEFVIMLSEVTDIEKVIDAIEFRLAQPFEITKGKQLKLSASIGVSVYPKDGKNLNELFKEADDRMYVRKRGHKGLR